MIQPTNINIADSTDLATLERFQKEPTVILELTPEQCPDFIVDKGSGKIIPQVRSIRINAAQWHLVPGKNKVPQSVYEFFLQSEAALKAAQKPIPFTNIGKLY